MVKNWSRCDGVISLTSLVTAGWNFPEKCEKQSNFPSANIEILTLVSRKFSWLQKRENFGFNLSLLIKCLFQYYSGISLIIIPLWHWYCNDMTIYDTGCWYFYTRHCGIFCVLSLLSSFTVHLLEIDLCIVDRLIHSG